MSVKYTIKLVLRMSIVLLCCNSITFGIDPQMQAFIETFCKQDVNLADIPLEQFRADEELFEPDYSIAIYKVQDLTIEGKYGSFPIRIYTPEKTDKALPIILFLHGGGWVWGSLNSHEGFCRELSTRTHSLVIAVDYHRAPEYKFPAAITDCYTAACWIAQHSAEFGGDVRHIGVMGDSAGGNLTAAVCLMARDKGFPHFAYQILLYPVLDFNFERASYTENGYGYFLTTQNMKWFWRQYLTNPETEQNNPYTAPLRAATLAGLPPAFLLLASLDPLRDEGLAYFARLHEAGNDVKCTVYEAIHCFVGFAHYLDVGKRAMCDIIDFVTLKNGLQQ